jgi:hypothetical protein
MALTTTDPFDLDIRFHAAEETDSGKNRPAISRDAYAGCLATGDAPARPGTPTTVCVADPPPRREDVPAHPATTQPGACISDPPERKA